MSGSLTKAKLTDLVHLLGGRLRFQAYVCNHERPDPACPNCADTAAYEAYLAAFPDRTPTPGAGRSVSLVEIMATHQRGGVS